jgi:hypothetical protein
MHLIVRINYFFINYMLLFLFVLRLHLTFYEYFWGFTGHKNYALLNDSLENIFKK